QVYAAWALHMLGHPVRAGVAMREAVESARALEHPFSLAYACHFAAGFHRFRGERQAARELEDAAFSLSTTHGFTAFVMAGGIHRGRLLAEEGRGEDGLAQMRQGLAGWRAIGAELQVPAFAALIGEVEGALGRQAEALALVNEGLESAARTGQHYWDA